MIRSCRRAHRQVGGAGAPWLARRFVSRAAVLAGRTAVGVGRTAVRPY